MQIKHFITLLLDTDASNVGIGAVLSQVHNGDERVIAYYSRALSKPQRNYCTTRRKLLAEQLRTSTLTSMPESLL